MLATRDARDLATAKGLNVSNSVCKLSRWRKFNGLARTHSMKPKKQKARAKAVPPAMRTYGSVDQYPLNRYPAPAKRAPLRRGFSYAQRKLGAAGKAITAPPLPARCKSARSFSRMLLISSSKQCDGTHSIGAQHWPVLEKL